MEDRAIIEALEARFNVQFREFQRAALKRILREEDVFICAPTGSGKTFCFAFLSELFELKDLELGHQVGVGAGQEEESQGKKMKKKPVTIVVSPLSSLIVDQVTRLKTLGINATFIGELQNSMEEKEAVRSGKVDVLFATPESLLESNWRKVFSSEV